MKLNHFETLIKSLIPADGNVEVMLEYNEQKSSYSTVGDYEKQQKGRGHDLSKSWIYPEERQLALNNNAMWTLHIAYPEKDGVKVEGKHSRSFSLEAILAKATGQTLSQEVLAEIKELTTFIDSLLVGVWTSAGIDFKTFTEYWQSERTAKTMTHYINNVEQTINDDDMVNYRDSWVGATEEEEKADQAKAIKANELWSFNWYPNTPIGSYTIHGSSLEIMVAEVNGYQKESKITSADFVVVFEDMVRVESAQFNLSDQERNSLLVKDDAGYYTHPYIVAAWSAFGIFLKMDVTPQTHDFEERAAFAKWLKDTLAETVSVMYNPYDDLRHEFMYQAWETALLYKDPNVEW